MDSQQAADLLKRYNEGIASLEETRLVENWFVKESRLQQAAPIDADYLGLKNQMWQVIATHTRTKKTSSLWLRISVAAAVLTITFTGLFYINRYYRNTQNQSIVYHGDAAPGGEKAFLTLSNGERISLTDIPVGKVHNHAGTAMVKTATGQLAWHGVKRNNNSGQANLNTLSTPRGGLWRLILPDGTKVWMNAASTLTFPSSFASNGARRVELSGEAYFEVTKDKAHPFIVKTAHQQVEVLGTHFNINSYSNEPVTRTTLLEGSVRVSSVQPMSGGLVVLRPGQQSVLSPAKLEVKAAVAEEEIAWKDNKFMFDGDNIERIMRKIERWYDVEVVYEGNMEGKNFEGSISRFKNVSEVLRKLELTGTIHFKIEGRRITVMP